MRTKLADAALRISLMYALFAAVWIAISDWFLSAVFSSPAGIQRLQTYKGWAFVAVTAGLLYLALRKQLQRWEREVTARKQAEETSRRDRLLASYSRDSILLLRQSDGRILEANPAALNTYGFNRADLLARTIHDLRVAGASPWPCDRPARLGEHGAMFETVHRRSDGSAIPVEVNRQATVIDGVPVFINVIRDITERERSNQQLRLRDAALAAAANGVVIADRAGTIVWVNAAFCIMTGHSAAEAVGQTPRIIKSGAHDAAFYKQMWSVILSGNVWRGHVVNKRKDGSLYDEDMIITPVADSGGEITHFIAIKQDITDRKRAEEELRKQAGELKAREQQNLRLLAELKNREEELREDDRRKDEFLAMLAHELRNPLAPIRNIVETPRLCDSAACAWGSSVVEQEVTHLARLLDDLLDVSRITRDQLQLKTERVLLTDVINTAAKSTRPFIDHNHHQLSVTLSAEPVYVKADKVRLVQVFVNLLNNAAKYTRQGGIIRLSAERRGGEAVVSVKDNGNGIAAEKLPYLFDLFYQAGRSYEQTHGGLGIGLTLVKRLVELQGGTVQARSDGINCGSEFIVRLPVLVEAIPTAKSQEPFMEAVSRRILVVDDYPNVAESMARRLTIAGHEVETALDGLQAIEVAERFRPDIVLLDSGMPKLDGYETARRIREQPWGMEMALVALTGWGQEEDRRLSREAGFDAHLVKPVEKNELAKLLARLPQARADAVPAEP
jgi:PAS domain S-box-containing protein